MESITRTPSTTTPSDSPRGENKKNFLDNMDTAIEEDSVENLDIIAATVFLEALPEPFISEPSSTPPQSPTEARSKVINAAKVTLESYLAAPKSPNSLNSQIVWNTGYFRDLNTGNGELWKERTVWSSHSRTAENNVKEAERIAKDDSETPRGCGVLFWGW